MSRLIKSLEYFCMFSSFPSISYLRNYILDSCRIYIYVVMWLTWSSEWAPNLASKLVDCSTKHATITIWWTMNARDWPGGSVRDVRDITCTKINAMILIEMIHKSILVCVRFYVNLFFFLLWMKLDLNLNKKENSIFCLKTLFQIQKDILVFVKMVL